MCFISKNSSYNRMFAHDEYQCQNLLVLNETRFMELKARIVDEIENQDN